MNPTNLFNPAPQHQEPTCPIHGQHRRGWMVIDNNPVQGIGAAWTMHICGLCVLEILRAQGFTITEPETLKESDWILDEIPEVKK